LNFRRPCGVPEWIVNAKGKAGRVYAWYATPWEVLRRLPGVAGYLKHDMTIRDLEREARAQSDLQATQAMQAAKQQLFAKITRRRTA
jgi:hypothetical protein